MKGRKERGGILKNEKIVSKNGVKFLTIFLGYNSRKFTQKKMDLKGEGGWG